MMSHEAAVRRPFVLGLAALACTLVLTVPLAAQSSWTYQLAWDHNGAASYRLCVNGQCQPLAARRTGGMGWQAPLPQFPPGEYRLVIEACTANTCVPGEPDLFVRVLAPSPRRPAIDILEGPRIPVNRR